MLRAAVVNHYRVAEAVKFGEVSLKTAFAALFHSYLIFLNSLNKMKPQPDLALQRQTSFAPLPTALH